MIDELEGPTPELTRGLPRAHGIFYATGIALICEVGPRAHIPIYIYIYR
jgi:hypothetical protein